MAKTVETPDLSAVRELLDRLNAKGPGYVMTMDEVREYVRRMPKMPPGWSSAEDVRDFRGPIAGDDADYA
ncbi:MAG: hypothetical protein M3Q69_10690 [Acidobacteriota bacterium]|nr:hypothetical protein [Acidobacteriota bacterium]